MKSHMEITPTSWPSKSVQWQACVKMQTQAAYTCSQIITYQIAVVYQNASEISA